VLQKGLVILALASVFKIVRPLILLTIQISFVLRIVEYMESINIMGLHPEAAKTFALQTLWHMGPLLQVVGNA
jgi:hypothetical protein